MSYEVYIDVRHHPRHLDDWAQRLTTGDKLAEPQGTDPSEEDRMRAVAGSLRDFADRIDPDLICGDCGRKRHEHIDGQWCTHRYGPRFQWPMTSASESVPLSHPRSQEPENPA